MQKISSKTYFPKDLIWTNSSNKQKEKHPNKLGQFSKDQRIFTQNTNNQSRKGRLRQKIKFLPISLRLYVVKGRFMSLTVIKSALQTMENANPRNLFRKLVIKQINSLPETQQTIISQYQLWAPNPKSDQITKLVRLPLNLLLHKFTQNFRQIIFRIIVINSVLSMIFSDNNKLTLQIDSSQSIYVNQTPKGTQKVIPKIYFGLNDAISQTSVLYSKKKQGNYLWKLQIQPKQAFNFNKIDKQCINDANQNSNNKNHEKQYLEKGPLKFLSIKRQYQLQNYQVRNQQQIYTFRENSKTCAFTYSNKIENQKPIDIEKRFILSAREDYENMLQFSDIQIISPSCSQFFSANQLHNQNPQLKKQDFIIQLRANKIQKTDKQNKNSMGKNNLESEMEQIYQGKFKIKRG